MAKSRESKKKISIMKLKVVVEKLRKSLLLAKPPASKTLPEDVKEGHFAVIAIDDGEHKRFVIPLNYLTHPKFLWLLEKTAEEFGFDHRGALTIPCPSRELQSILAEQWKEREVGAAGGSAGVGWASSN